MFYQTGQLVRPLHYFNTVDSISITEVQHLEISNIELLSDKIIMLTSDRRFICQFKKSSEDILVYDRVDFNSYLSLEKLNTLKQLFVYILTDSQRQYLHAYKDINNISKYMERTIFSELSILYNKPIKDIYTVFKAPKMYVSVMYALANGCHNSGDVAEFLDIKQTTVSKYLKELEKLGYIGYATPIDTFKNKRGKCIIKSPYYHFWFRFIYQNLYVCHNQSKVLNDLKANVLEFIIENYLCEYCQFLIKKDITYGTWRNSRYKIDVIGICKTDKVIYIAKYFTDSIVNKKDYGLIKQITSAQLESFNDYTFKYYLFSSKDFDEELKDWSNSNENLILKYINLETNSIDDVSKWIIPVRKKIIAKISERRFYHQYREFCVLQ